MPLVYRPDHPDANENGMIEKHKAPPKGGVSIYSDIAPFVTQDGTEITSRSGLRAYEQRNGVKQIGNDMASFNRELRASIHGHH